MKSKLNLGCFALIASLFVFALPAKSQHKEFEQWKELKDFHAVISKTFHPAEEGNFKPIRERSTELNAVAEKLAASKIPSDLNRREVIAAVKELNTKTKELDVLIKAKGSDEKVNTLLTSVHDSFHKIVGLCSKDDEHDKGHHEHGKEMKHK